MLSQFIVNGFITGLLYSLIALAFGITYNASRVFHLAYAAVIVFASYFLIFFLRKGLPDTVAIPLALLVTGLLNMGIELLLYRPMAKRRRSANSILVASIGVFIVLTNLVSLLFGNETQRLNAGSGSSWQFGAIIITKMQSWQFFTCLSLIIVSFMVFYKTRAGLLVRAISSDAELFIVFGKNSYRIRSILFFISGVLAGIVAFLISYDVGFDPYYGMPLLLNGMVAMIAGGIGSYAGSVAGGVLLGLLQSFSVYYFEARWETALTFSILFIVLLLRPQGLFGLKERTI